MATITSPRSESPANPIPRITSPQIPQSPSISGTPTSSVRPSIEIPVRTNSSSPSRQQQNATATSTPAGPQTQQRRNRAALRDYYNLKGKAPSGTGGAVGGGNGGQNMSRTASIASNASDSTMTSSATHQIPDSASAALPAQLDDPSFDAEAHVSELLKTASLRDILRTESVLVSEIRTLDGERKALVYDNYSKLIKAVGTIAEMQKGMHKRGEYYGQQQDRFSAALGRNEVQSLGLEGVEKLGGKLDTLVTVVKELAPAKTEGEANDGHSLRNRDLTRQQETVKWALGAPSRLQDLVARQELDEARREHEAVLEVLTHWKGVPGVDELQAKCASLMMNVRKTSGHSDDEEHDSEEEEEDADDSD